MLKALALLTATFAGVQLMSANVDPAAPADYTQQIETWRAQRVERLKAPNGWLSLIGLHWLKDGKNTVGSAKSNDIVLAKGPARLGTIVLKDGKATVTLDAKAGATIDGKAARSALLLDDSHEQPTTVAFGSASFYLIERNGKYGLRVKDSEADARKHFAGIDTFAIDPSWRIEAQWVPFEPAHTLEVPNVLGQTDTFPVPGKAVFTRDGKTYELLPVIEVPGDKELFLIFADRTSGKETYGAARFLYAPMPTDGKIVLDFNKAYNPPCAFTPYATCPLAPPENRLDLPVTAGEKKYRGGTH
ncbi:MAG: DUF1684 domain-containing protein [Rhodanobacteraceae bacterium]|jgi:hypothetical protein|nr:DUF1684 domain-containing protein [Rhodanobacteraceae bacterium]